MNEKKSFLLFTDTASVFNALADEQAGALIKAIVEYVNSGELPMMDSTMMALFIIFKNQIDANQAKWEDTKAKRTEAGRLGGIKKAENRAKAVANATDVKQTVANDSKGKQSVANLAVTDTVTVTVTDIKEKVVSNDTTKKKDTKPTLDECVSFFSEKGSTAEEAQRYFDHYEANGWRVGKNPMKDWKAAARNWLSSEYRTKQNTAPVDRAKLLGKVVDRQEHSGHDILAQRKPFRLKAE